MTPSTFPAASAATHVEAFCCTGSSPGACGHATVRIELEWGGTVAHRIGYELHGGSRPRTVVVLGGISADRHLLPTPVSSHAGWWPGVIGPGAALDPERDRLLGIDWLGGPERTGGASFDVPVTSADQARALAAVLDHLGIESVVLVGASFGGMVAMAFAALFPARVTRLVALCAAHRTHPMATALRAVQRRFVRFADEVGYPDVGLREGRALAMTTYRSSVEFDARFDVGPVAGPRSPRFPVEEYLEARGAAFAERFDAATFLRLSESIDLHTVDPRRVVAPTTLVSIDTDTLVPPWLVDELAARLPGRARHVALSSVYGHDGFLKEVDAVSAVVRSALGTGGDR